MAVGTAERAETGTANLAAAGLALIAVSYGFARFAYGLFVPTFRAEFGLDAATAGAIAASSYAVYCLAILTSTAMTARHGARPVALAAGVLATAGTALIAAAPDAGGLAVGVVLAGASTGTSSPPLAEAVAMAVTGAARDRAQAVVNSGTGLGVLLSGPIALVAAENWRWAWAGFAACAALSTWWIAGAVPRRSPRPASATASGPLLPVGATRLLSAALLTGVASSAVWTFGRDVVIGVGGVSPTGSSVLWIVLGSAGLLGAFTGHLVQRLGLTKAWTWSMLGIATATGLWALGASSPVAVFGAATLFGAVYIGLTGLLLLWGTRIYSGSPARGVGAAFLTLAVGQTIGAPAVGLLIDTVGARPAFLVAASVAVLAATVRPSRVNGTVTPF